MKARSQPRRHCQRQLFGTKSSCSTKLCTSVHKLQLAEERPNSTSPTSKPCVARTAGAEHEAEDFNRHELYQGYSPRNGNPRHLKYEDTSFLPNVFMCKVYTTQYLLIHVRFKIYRFYNSREGWRINTVHSVSPSQDTMSTCLCTRWLKERLRSTLGVGRYQYCSTTLQWAARRTVVTQQLGCGLLFVFFNKPTNQPKWLKICLP